jgi:hypothetical protein
MANMTLGTSPPTPLVNTTLDRILPDMSTKTHLIALCGVPDVTLADPEEDGWFFSDFFLFNKLFAGLGASRAWFTCVDPRKLVETYKEYAHGNPWQTRHVVLDKNTTPSDVLVKTAAGLLDAFLEYFRQECEIAAKAGEPIFLMVFGHGKMETKGVYIGQKIREDGSLYEPLLQISHIKKVMDRYPSLQLGILMTSCFSGGWTVLNATAMTAVNEDDESESWAKSKSCGRACGSIFVSAIVETLIKEDQEVGLGNPQHRDYRTFTDDIRTRLNKLDRFGDQQTLTFSAQDSGWNDEHHARTGIPLTEYKKRVDRLKLLTPADKKIHGDRSTDEYLAEIGQRGSSGPSTLEFYRSIKGRTGGSRSSVERAIQVKAKEYQASHPGRATKASNIQVDTAISVCLKGNATEDQLQRASAMLLYREQVGILAEELRDVMDLGPFPRFHLWGFEEHFIPQYRNVDIHVGPFGELFPAPLADEGRPWAKPFQYLRAAFVEKGLGPDEIEEKIAVGREFIRQRKEEVIEELTVEFRARRRDNWFKTINDSVRKTFRSRSRSPTKPRSKSPSKKGKRFSLG